MKGDRFPVLEIFGPTIQGEGMVIGRKTMFIRTAGCDYSCSWCDSAFTWDGSGKEDIRWMAPEKILEELDRLGAGTFDHVTLSGGNPALLGGLGKLIDSLHARGWSVALETQGSRWQDWFAAIDDLTLSPKPPSSGMETDWRVLDAIVGKLREVPLSEERHRKDGPAGEEHSFRKPAARQGGTAGENTVAAGSRGRLPDGRNARGTSVSLKVVVMDDADLAYARTVHLRYPGVPFFLQPGNPDVAEEDQGRLLHGLLGRYEWLVGCVMEDRSMRNVRVLPQLHTWLWGNRRGV
ncbi:7-carboxy-7-deazaguanine synthase QueE [Paenibacillus aurantius]|uniref:7-carboxy-7-deazaguanine synthase n=1 Tax=Paenibacillus aurantius TaxID=2918900 RepID=A0AA96LHU0_9BACL|nr:7-carboxy-7-deazaguanine synthase QueE [Paenibacillus aurantius]WNQ12320.1 7-carboxy-7-deazaguanine synthase QueE [Paenibacillus aurantius]